MFPSTIVQSMVPIEIYNIELMIMYLSLYKFMKKIKKKIKEKKERKYLFHYIHNTHTHTPYV